MNTRDNVIQSYEDALIKQLRMLLGIYKDILKKECDSAKITTELMSTGCCSGSDYWHRYRKLKYDN